MSPVKILGACGLLSSLLLLFSASLGGYGVPAAGAVMTFGNLQALLRKEHK